MSPIRGYEKDPDDEERPDNSLDDFLSENSNLRKREEVKEKIFSSRAYKLPTDYLEILVMDSYLPKDYNNRASFGKFSTTIVELLPKNAAIKKVPQHILGPYVLGRAFIGINTIEILDTLYGDSYQAVLDHEAYHILFPEKPESEVRERTKVMFPGFFSRN